jgi:multidrug efflux pump subunit AcrB
MIVSDTAVNKSITVMVLAVIIIVFGVYCYNVLPRESDPDITHPQRLCHHILPGGITRGHGDQCHH